MLPQYVWSEDVAWVEDDAGMTVTLMPDGPVVILAGGEGLLAAMRDSFTVKDLVVAARSGGRYESPEVLEDAISEFVLGLEITGLLISSESG